MSGPIMNGPFLCWCPGCGRVKTDYEPFPFCHHGAPASPHTARRMRRLPSYHPLAAVIDGRAGSGE